MSNHAVHADPSNLVPGRTSFLGRARELDDVCALITSGVALVTVHGPPGIGKSRLAVEAAARLRSTGTFVGGVWTCELSGVRSADELVAAVSRAVGGGGAVGAPIEVVGRELATRGPILVVLDDAELAVEGTRAVLTRWLSAAGNAQFIVTSRERLNIGPETCRDLAPLSPADAAELFRQRAEAHRPLELGDAERAILGEIVERLDANPLAIELAAARVVALSLADIRARLDQRFALLTTRRSDVPARHASLRRAIDSSWDLLPEWGRVALRQCIVFRGGFTLSEAEAVVRVDGEAPPVSDIIEELLGRSLVRSWRPAGAPLRLGISQAIFDYLRDVAGDLDAARQRHAETYLARAEAWAAAYDSDAGAAGLDALALELDNILAVASRLQDSDPARACRATLSLFQLVRVRRLYSTHAPLFDDAVACAVAAQSKPLEARARWARAALLLNAGAHAEAEPELARVASLAASLGDVLIEADALVGMGAIVFTDSERWRDAGAHWSRAAQLFEAAGKPTRCANALANLALSALDTGDIDGAAQHCDRALALIRDARVVHRLSFPLMVSAAVAEERGEPDVARERYDEAIAVARDVHKHVGHEAEALTHRGILECGVGEWDTADELLARAHSLYDSIGNAAESGITDAFFAVTRAHVGHASQADELLGASGEALARLSARGSERFHAIASELVSLALGRPAASSEPAPAESTRDAQPLPQFIRAAERILARQRAAATRSEHLRIGPGGRWFERGVQPRVDLRRRMLLRRLLVQLGTERVQHPGRPLSNASIIAACWPGETIQREAAFNRLYVALSKLRGLGLGGLIVNDADGYLLTKDVTVELLNADDA